MNALILGMFFLLVGAYFSNILVIGFGAVFLVLGLYLNKSTPDKPQPATEKKTKHTVVMGEPPEQAIYPWETGELPISGNLDKRGFLPLPEYGFSSPLEKVFFGFPFKFWEKK